MVSYILTGYSILLFMNPLNFVAVILKVLLVNLLAALNFANVILNKKSSENKKTLKNVKNVTKIKKNVKTFFTSVVKATSLNVLSLTVIPNIINGDCWF